MVGLSITINDRYIVERTLTFPEMKISSNCILYRNGPILLSKISETINNTICLTVNIQELNNYNEFKM